MSINFKKKMSDVVDFGGYENSGYENSEVDDMFEKSLTNIIRYLMYEDETTTESVSIHLRAMLENNQDMFFEPMIQYFRTFGEKEKISPEDFARASKNIFYIKIHNYLLFTNEDVNQTITEGEKYVCPDLIGFYINGKLDEFLDHELKYVSSRARPITVVPEFNMRDYRKKQLYKSTSDYYSYYYNILEKDPETFNNLNVISSYFDITRDQLLDLTNDSSSSLQKLIPPPPLGPIPPSPPLPTQPDSSEKPARPRIAAEVDPLNRIPGRTRAQQKALEAVQQCPEGQYFDTSTRKCEDKTSAMIIKEKMEQLRNNLSDDDDSDTD